MVEGLRGILYRWYLDTDKWNKEVLAKLAPRGSGKGPRQELLDCGCGDGELTMRIAKRMGLEMADGIELDEDLYREAMHNGVMAYQNDLNEPILAFDNYYDVVVASQVIEDLSETDVFLHEVNRVLKPSGVLLLSTPNLSSLHNILPLILGRQPFTASVSDEIVSKPFGPYHIRDEAARAHRRLFTWKGLRDVLDYHGFAVERMLGVGFYPFPPRVADWVNRVAGRWAVYLTVRAMKRGM